MDGQHSAPTTSSTTSTPLSTTSLSSSDHPRILAAIPCYNEEIAIGSVVLRAKKHVTEVLVVDDGSTDVTASVAKSAGAIVILHTGNKGKAAAVLSAVQYTQNHLYDILVLLDGDGQHNPDEIPSIVAPILAGNADLVIGSRFLQQISGKNGVPTYRRIGQKTLDAATNANSSFKTTDSQSGFRALSKKAFSAVDFTSDDYNIESDMISHMAEKGLVIAEVPITAIYSPSNGYKKNPLVHGIDIFGHIIGIISYRRPLLSFGIPGFFLTVIGLAGELYTFSEYFAKGSFHYVIFIVGLVGIILGLLLVTSALILNSLVLIVKSQKEKF